MQKRPITSLAAINPKFAWQLLTPEQQAAILTYFEKTLGS
jgi:hypothetical protein